MSAGDLVSGEIKHTATPWIADEFGKIWSADGSVCVADCKPVDFMGQRQSDKPKTRIGNAKFIVRACNEYDELKLKATHYDWLLNEARKTGVSVRFVNGGKDMCVGGIIDESIFDGLVSALKRMLDAFHEDPFENNTSGAVEEAYEALEKAGAK